MPGKREQLLRALRVPYADAAVAVGGGEHLAVGAEGHGGDPVGVLLDLMLKLAGPGGPEFNEPARPAQRDLRLVGADVGGEHGVVVVTQRQHALARADVPEPAPACLRAAAATGKQPLAAAAELHLDRLALGERQNPEWRE